MVHVCGEHVVVRSRDREGSDVLVLLVISDSMKNLVNLQVLDLRHNKFKDVPTVVYELRTLKTLYLRFNKIKTVSSSIGKLEVNSGDFGRS